MKKFIFLGLLSVLLCPAAGCGQADETSRSWNQPVKPFRIAGNLYYLGASDLSSFLIVTPQGHILLDSGLVETVPQIQHDVVQLGFRFLEQGEKQNPYIDPNGYKRYIEENEQAFQKELERLRH